MPRHHSHGAGAGMSGAGDSPSMEGLIAALRREGLRITANRQGILQALLGGREPLSLEEIQIRAAAWGSRPDFATVFRTMAVLERLKLAQKVHLQRSASHYELIDPQRHRDHLVCVDCGRVTLLEDLCPVEKVERKIAKQFGFTGVTHSLEFYGHCRDCTVKEGC